jgi:hypothetical protein
VSRHPPSLVLTNGATGRIEIADIFCVAMLLEDFVSEQSTLAVVSGASPSNSERRFLGTFFGNRRSTPTCRILSRALENRGRGDDRLRHEGTVFSPSERLASKVLSGKLPSRQVLWSTLCGVACKLSLLNCESCGRFLPRISINAALGSEDSPVFSSCSI